MITSETFKGGPDAPTIADVEGYPGVVELQHDGDIMVMPLCDVEGLCGGLEHFRYVGTVPVR